MSSHPLALRPEPALALWRRAAVALKAALVLLLATFLQGSGCHAHICSGDGCDDDEDPNGGSGAQLLVLPPPLDPLGRPVGGPVWFIRGPLEAQGGAPRTIRAF